MSRKLSCLCLMRDVFHDQGKSNKTIKIRANFSRKNRSVSRSPSLKIKKNKKLIVY